MLTRRRLYFLLSDSDSARGMLDEMLLARIAEISDIVARRHPEAVSRGFEPTIVFP